MADVTDMWLGFIALGYITCQHKEEVSEENLVLSFLQIFLSVGCVAKVQQILIKILILKISGLFRYAVRFPLLHISILLHDTYTLSVSHDRHVNCYDTNNSQIIFWPVRKSAKSNHSFTMTVCPRACLSVRIEKLWFHCMDFYISDYFLKFLEKIHVHIH